MKAMMDREIIAVLLSLKKMITNKKYKLKFIEIHLTAWKKIQVRNLTFRLTTGC